MSCFVSILSRSSASQIHKFFLHIMQWVAETMTTAISSEDKSPPTPATTAGPQEATTFALLYGLPLHSYSKLASNVEANKGEFVTNAFYYQEQLVNADFNDVVRPNVDTLYSEALVDLSSHGLIVTIPEVPSDRFYVFPIYDIYGNNVVNIGTAGISSTPGRYLLTYRPADPGYSSGDDTYSGYIYLPTPYGAIISRIQVNGPDDVKEVRALQVQFTLTSVPTPLRLAPKLTKSLLFDGLSTNDTEKLLQLTARLSHFNLPEVGFDIARVNAILRRAGLSQGSYTTPPGVDLTRAKVDAVAAIRSVHNAHFAKYFRELGNDWSKLRDDYSGDFKEDYLVRAFVSALGYLQLKPDQAIYPLYKVASEFTSDKSYTVTFSGKPPVNGFWSLTVYNSEAYLVANQWNIYALGDRSAIEYPDGSLVYPKSGSLDKDGEFTILLQTLDIPPPQKYRPNWIPTPGTSARFDFTIRWYGPTKDLESYVYPSVKELSEPVR